MGVGPGGVANVPLMGGGRQMWRERSHTREEGARDRARPVLLPEAQASPAAQGSDMEDTHSWQSESRLVHRPAVAVELWISPPHWALL